MRTDDASRVTPELEGCTFKAGEIVGDGKTISNVTSGLDGEGQGSTPKAGEGDGDAAGSEYETGNMAGSSRRKT
jgi:hypothetical protein